jgi:hypothetical protein
VDGAFKVTGFMVLVMGWLLTSKEARQVLASDPLVRKTAIAGLAAASLVYAYISVGVSGLSQRVFFELEKLKYVPSATYENHLIGTRTLIPWIVANVLLTGFAGFFIWRLGTRGEASPRLEREETGRGAGA